MRRAAWLSMALARQEGEHTFESYADRCATASIRRTDYMAPQQLMWVMRCTSSLRHGKAAGTTQCGVLIGLRCPART